MADDGCVKPWDGYVPYDGPPDEGEIAHIEENASECSSLVHEEEIGRLVGEIRRLRTLIHEADHERECSFVKDSYPCDCVKSRV